MLTKIAELYIEFINQERLRYGYQVATIDFKVNEKSGQIDLLIPSYYYDIESGTPPKSQKVPILNIVNWLKKIGENATNNAVFAIQTAIYNNGVKPKKGFVSNPINNASDPSLEIMSINLSEYLEQKIKAIR